MNFEVNSSKYIQCSIFKSKSQKNWQSTPGSTKQFTFQFNVQKKPKVRKPRDELTMVKADKLASNKWSGISPFLYTPEEFPEDTATQNIETTENGSKLKSKMRVLNRDEVPEQLMI